MKKTLILLPAIFLITLPSGCSKDDTTSVSEDGTITVTAGAVAQRDASGNITVREATGRELESVRSWRAEYDEIDNKYPGPPENMESFKVREITDEGIFILEDGLKIKMSGIICTRNGSDILRRLFDKESDEISFYRESTLPDGTVLAHVWEVDPDPSMPGISGLSDTVVMNKWCAVDDTNPSRFHERYVALSKLDTGR